MAQKIVSFEVAKALKEAGYPQTTRPIHCYNEKGQLLGRGGNYIRGVKYDATTYLDAWLWLWRKKKIAIGCPYENTYNYWLTNINAENDKSLILWKYSSGEREDPEEAIVKAIDYLVDNDLIK